MVQAGGLFSFHLMNIQNGQGDPVNFLVAQNIHIVSCMDPELFQPEEQDFGGWGKGGG